MAFLSYTTQQGSPHTHTFSFLQTKTLISIIVKKMKCITDKSENEMKDRAKAGTGEYWWSWINKCIKHELGMKPAIKKTIKESFTVLRPWCRTNTARWITMNSLWIIRSAASWTSSDWTQSFFLVVLNSTALSWINRIRVGCPTQTHIFHVIYSRSLTPTRKVWIMPHASVMLNSSRCAKEQENAAGDRRLQKGYQPPTLIGYVWYILSHPQFS